MKLTRLCLLYALGPELHFKTINTLFHFYYFLFFSILTRKGSGAFFLLVCWLMNKLPCHSVMAWCLVSRIQSQWWLCQRLWSGELMSSMSKGHEETTVRSEADRRSLLTRWRGASAERWCGFRRFFNVVPDLVTDVVLKIASRWSWYWMAELQLNGRYLQWSLAIGREPVDLLVKSLVWHRLCRPQVRSNVVSISGQRWSSVTGGKGAGGVGSLGWYDAPVWFCYEKVASKWWIW